MAELHFDFRDIFRAGRYGFSGKKITVHFAGLVFAYLIYEILVYLSLIIAGGSVAKDFWNKYGLLPVCPVVDYSLETNTIVAMWLGMLVLFVVFFLTSTMVSRITIQQLRGDHFFSMGDSLGFVKKNWKSVFGTFIGLIVIFVFCAITPIVVGLLGKIPAVGRILVLLASILTPLAFFLGLLMAYLTVVFGVSLFLVPSVVAAADSDTFETIYQHFSVIWNQPWRIIVYETLLFGIKLICTPIWALFCLVGFAVVMLPIRLLIPEDMGNIMWQTNGWLGGLIDKLVGLPYIEGVKVFDIAEPGNFAITLKIASIFMTLSLLFIVGLVIAYLLSIASAGNTLIYTMLRRRTDGENLLEVEEEEGADIVAPTPSIDQGETQSEEGASEQSEEGTSETQSSNEEKSETDEPNKDDAT
jgi:hypothetical protein